MSASSAVMDRVRKALESQDLSFRDFVEIALYAPGAGYYTRDQNPVGKMGDYVTSPLISPVFAFALSKLISEFVRRVGDGPSTIVDVGCGDGQLLHSLYVETPAELRQRARFFGVDRSQTRLAPAVLQNAALRFVTSIDQVPRSAAELILSNELFDAFPFARLVQRHDGLHELCVVERDGALDWNERPAPGAYRDYFASRGIGLEEGQFADISLDWERVYRDLAGRIEHGLIVTFDYGYPQQQLFHPRARRFGTAAAYSGHLVTRDLLANPGEHDLTAHINFTDLIRSGEAEGLTTLFFDRQAKFLLALGATEHELLRPIDEATPANLQEGIDLLQQREDARRLLLPDGIGEDIRVLVQERGIGRESWSFQKRLY